MDGHAFLRAELEKIDKADASDLYIKSRQKLRYRVAENVKILGDKVMSREAIEALVAGITNDYHKKLLKEYGSVDFALDIEGIGRIRLNVFNQRGELCIVIRRVKNVIPPPEELRIPEIMMSMAEEQRGLILIAGPTSSGKTTTIASMVQHVNDTMERHVITVEDPIEYSYTDNKSMINQREVGADTVSFHSSLRYIVRQAPDVIMIGELRDQETFSAALAASETGRLLITTVHARNVTQVFERVLGFFPATQHDRIMIQLSFNLRCVCAQRMLTQADGISVVPAFEIMTMTPAAQKLVAERRVGQLVQLMQQGAQDGMQTFNQSLHKLFEAKLITQEEAFRASDNPQQLAMNMKGIFLDEAAGGILGS